VIGRYTGDGKLHLTYGDEVCAYVDVEFLEKGFPQWHFAANWLPPRARGLIEPVLGQAPDLGGLILDLLHTPNLCARNWINRQYDHEVQGTSVVKPFVGRRQEVPSDAAVLLPVLEGTAGLALASVLLTEYGDIDTYHMVTASVEEGMRRVTAVGGDPAQVGGLDNFCWPSIQHHPETNPDGDYKAAQLVRACWGLKDACEALEVPLLSGKDSMYVDGTLTGRHGLSQRVSGPPTMMFTATAPVPDLSRAQTLEPKLAGDLVYVLGQTRDELGASALYGMLGHVGLNLPQTDFKASKRLCLAVSKALDQGLLASCCVVSRGGLAYALARMALAGELGLEIDLGLLPALEGLSDLRRLFSESTGRMVVTVAPKRHREFEQLLKDIDWAPVGKVTRPKRLVITSGSQTRADLEISGLRRAFIKRFGKLV
jgi:phosphoribosylformylglycinamidine synthase